MKIKQLKWEKRGDDYYAFPLEYTYTLSHFKGTWMPSFRMPNVTEGCEAELAFDEMTLVEAKAAAQAHWEAELAQYLEETP